MDQILTTILSGDNLLLGLCVVVIGALWKKIGGLEDRLDKVSTAYHEDSKLNTIALNALTDWIKDRQK